MNRRETAIRAGLVAAAIGSLLWAALPTARHVAGVIALEAPKSRIVPVGKPEPPLDLAAIYALAPFGRAQAPDGAPDIGTTDHPTITLRGIFAARDATSTALLDVSGTPGLYQEAMQVSGRLEVSRITPVLVELSDGDTTITLRFDDDAEIATPTAVAKSEVPSSLLNRLQGGFVIPAKYKKPGKPETTAEYIDYWRGRVRKNPQAVLEEIGLTATENGYIIADQHDVGVRLAGLRSGDLVRSVNGQPVGDPEADRRFYDEIAAAGQARIEVERGGRVLSFSFPLR